MAQLWNVQKYSSCVIEEGLLSMSDTERQFYDLQDKLEKREEEMISLKSFQPYQQDLREPEGLSSATGAHQKRTESKSAWKRSQWKTRVSEPLQPLGGRTTKVDSEKELEDILQEKETILGSHSQLRMEQLDVEIIQLQVSYLRCSWKWCWCLPEVGREILNTVFLFLSSSGSRKERRKEHLSNWAQKDFLDHFLAPLHIII